MKAELINKKSIRNALKKMISDTSLAFKKKKLPACVGVFSFFLFETNKTNSFKKQVIFFKKKKSMDVEEPSGIGFSL